MKKQLQGIALILFGTLLILAENCLNLYITYSSKAPWSFLGLLIGIAGIILVFLKTKKDDAQS